MSHGARWPPLASTILASTNGRSGPSDGRRARVYDPTPGPGIRWHRSAAASDRGL